MPLGDLTPQLRTRLYRTDRFVGLFVGVAALLMLLGFGYYLYHTAERRGWFVPTAPYFTFVESAAGLKVGDPVLLLGFSVGEITVIDAQPPNSYYNVFVAFKVRRPYYGYVWTDSRVRIASGDLLGGRTLQITKGVDGKATVYEVDGEVSEVLIDGERVPLEEAPKGVFVLPIEEPALAKRAEALLESLEATLPRITAALLTTLEEDLPRVTAPLIATLEEDLPRITARVEALLATADTTVARAGALAGEAEPVLENLQEITGTLRDPDGSLGRWLLTPEMRDGLVTTLTGLTANLEALQETLRNVAAITGSLRGQVEANEHVLDEITNLVRETEELVKGLKRHWLLRGTFAEEPLPTVDETIDDPLLAPPGEASQ